MRRLLATQRAAQARPRAHVRLVGGRRTRLASATALLLASLALQRWQALGGTHDAEVARKVANERRVYGTVWLARLPGQEHLRTLAEVAAHRQCRKSVARGRLALAVLHGEPALLAAHVAGPTIARLVPRHAP